jgi:hypothetical protein
MHGWCCGLARLIFRLISIISDLHRLALVYLFWIMMLMTFQAFSFHFPFSLFFSLYKPHIT